MSGEPMNTMMWILRGVFSVLVIGVSVFVATHYADRNSVWSAIFSLVIIILIGALVIITDITVRRKEITTISAIYFGLLLGLLLSALFTDAMQAYLKDGVEKELVQPIRILITIVFCYVVTSTLLQTKDEFRFIIPYVEFSKQVKGNRPMALDTSVIIDGRIADICDTRFIDSKLIVPRFVLQE